MFPFLVHSFESEESVRGETENKIVKKKKEKKSGCCCGPSPDLHLLLQRQIALKSDTSLSSAEDHLTNLMINTFYTS